MYVTSCCNDVNHVHLHPPSAVPIKQCIIYYKFNIDGFIFIIWIYKKASLMPRIPALIYLLPVANDVQLHTAARDNHAACVTETLRT